jgi:hypothetical protein
MAAGLGFKTFTTGEVLTAADTNGYLMQGVLVFASSAARAAAITSPQEGQYSYLKDTNSTEYYDGAAWIAAPVGDITAVSAGTGISVASGTGPVPVVTNSMATEIAAKGDLIAGTGSATFDNLPVGTNGQTLVADSTASTGLKWATASSPSYAWTTFTPTFYNFTLGNGTVTFAQTLQIDKIVFLRLRVTLGSTSSVTGGIAFSGFPTPSENNSLYNGIAVLNGYAGVGQMYDSILNLSYFSTASGVSTLPSNTTTLPSATWTTGMTFNLTTWYKAA